MNVETVLGRDFHGDFDRSERLISDDTDTGDIADVNALQPHGCAHAESTGIVEVALKNDFAGKQAARSTHEENQDS